MSVYNPAVSVIIPSFNRARLVGKAVQSVLDQGFKDFELIVVDDGSTDETPEVLSGYPSIKKIRLPANRGVSHARNVGFEHSQGRRVCFLDSDDWWKPEKLSLQMEWMDARPDIPLCHTEEIWIRNGVRVNPMNKHKKSGGHIFQHCLPLCVISPSSVMMDSKVFKEIGGFDETLPACEDYDLWIRLTTRHPVGFLPEPLVVKTGGHEDQLSRKYWGMDRFRVKALEKILQDENLSPEYRRLVLETLVGKYGILKNGAIKRNKISEAEAWETSRSDHAGNLSVLTIDESRKTVSVET